MATEYAWFLPTGRYGDGHEINPVVSERPPTVDYLSTVAKAAEKAGFVNLLVPTGTHCLDSWLFSQAVAERTSHIKFCVAFRPGLMSPVLAAQQANTFDSITKGRLTINIVTGSTPVDQKRYGDHLNHDERYERTEEFLDIVKALWSGDEPVNFNGKYYQIENATIFAKPFTKPHPPIYLGASSEIGRQVGAKHSDVHLMWAVEPESVKKDVLDMQKRAEEIGRKNIRFGIRLHILCRESKEEARKCAEILIEGSDINNTEVHADQRNRSESEGQRRMNELASKESLWITDTLWMGVNKVRAGAGATLVGTPDMIADTLKEYVETGVDCFILSGWPHLEEAEIFGREIMPLLQETNPMTFHKKEEK